jgi:hypothetical protein
MPVTDLLWVRGRMFGVPGDEAWRLFWSAARRLDGGHLQIERIRQALEVLPPTESPAGRQAMQEIIGDVEMAIWSLDKALDIAVRIPGAYRVEVGVPRIVAEKRPLVAVLRDHWSHIDDRALGMVKGVRDPKAEDAFEFASIFVDRLLSDGRSSLGIDEEATELCIATRSYLLAAWSELTRTAHANWSARAG